MPLRWSSISVFPKWYQDAFGNCGNLPQGLTDEQRMLPGKFVLKDGNQFFATVFGFTQKGKLKCNSTKTLYNGLVYFRREAK